jgi:hypothetical protein
MPSGGKAGDHHRLSCETGPLEADHLVALADVEVPPPPVKGNAVGSVEVLSHGFYLRPCRSLVQTDDAAPLRERDVRGTRRPPPDSP